MKRPLGLRHRWLRLPRDDAQLHEAAASLRLGENDEPCGHVDSIGERGNNVSSAPVRGAHCTNPSGLVKLFLQRTLKE